MIIKGVVIPEGNVKAINVNGVPLFSASSGDAGGDAGGDSGGSVEKYSWEGVAASIKAGTYATDYAIGDLIPLDLGSEGLVNMEIVAFDADELADGSGKAAISWVSKELLKSAHVMNDSAAVRNSDGTYKIGTGTIGGWEATKMRTYLNDTILTMIPSEVRSMIKTVAKMNVRYTAAGNQENDHITNDILWIPSRAEIKGGTSSKNELAFPNYTLAEHPKKTVGTSTESQWWLRNASMLDSFHAVNVGSGSVVTVVAYDSSAKIALGFCT